MKKLLAILLVALMLCVTCTPVFAEEEVAYNPDAIIYCYSTADPTHLDPALCTDGQSTVVTGLVFNALIGYTMDGGIVCDAAESYETSEDGLTYTFHLRQGMKFHDGTTLDANAVVWNWDRVYKNATADMAYSNTFFGSVASYEATDDYTFVVTLSHADTTFLTLQGSASLACGLVSPTAYEADPEGFDRHPVGAGPYKFDEWVSGQYVKVSRFDDYYGEVCNGGVVVRIIPEASTAASELMVGGIDYMGDLSADQRDLLSTADNVKVITSLSTNASYLSFADFSSNAIFSDIRLRQAVCYALDMESINAALFGNAMENATSVLPTCMQAGADEYSIIGYDPEKAKELMAEAGYADGFSFTLLTYNVSKGYNPAGEQLAVQMQAELAKVGIDMQITIEPWAEFLEDCYMETVEGYDAVLHGWGADYNDSSNFIMLFTEAECGDGYNHAGYVSEEFEAEYYAALTASTYEEAGEHYHNCAQLINDDCAVYTLGHGLGFMGVYSSILNAEEVIGGWGNHIKDMKKAA